LGLNLEEWMVVATPPLLLVSVAVWLRCHRAVVRWSVASLLFVAMAAGALWLVRAPPAHPFSVFLMVMIASATWGAFFGAALRPFGGRPALAVLASVCVAILMVSAVTISMVRLGLTPQHVKRMIYGVEVAPR
jgi:hypothetical protein